MTKAQALKLKPGDLVRLADADISDITDLYGVKNGTILTVVNTEDHMLGLWIYTKELNIGLGYHILQKLSKQELAKLLFAVR